MRSKKNKKKLIIAIFLGVIATFSLFSSMSGQKSAISQQQAMINKLTKELKSKGNDIPLAEPKEEKLKALVAAMDINVGDIFVLEALEVKEFSPDELSKDVEYYKTKAMIVGKKAGKNITKGGFITAAEIRENDPTAINIPDDMRAITIPVEKFRGLASHIKAGSRVDILKVSNPPEFIAQNIKIISFETNTPQVTRRSVRDTGASQADLVTAKTASAITFLVSIDIVSTLIDAMLEGQLQVITRNNNDEKIVVTEAELPAPPSSNEIASLPEPEEDLPEPQMPAPEPQTIEIIKASNVTTMEVRPQEYQLNQKDGNDPLSDEKLRELLDMVNQGE